MGSRAALSGFERSYGAGYSVVYAGGGGGFDGVVVGGLWHEASDAHSENHVGTGRVAAIGRLGDLRQVRGVGAVVHDAVVQIGASGASRSPSNNRHGLIRDFEFRTCRDFYDAMCRSRSDHAGIRKKQQCDTREGRD